MTVDDLNRSFYDDMKEYERITMEKCCLKKGIFQSKANDKNAILIAKKWIGTDSKKSTKTVYFKLLECKQKKQFNALNIA